MQRKYIVLVLVIFFITAISACKEDDNTISPTTTSIDSSSTDSSSDSTSDTNSAPTASLLAISGQAKVYLQISASYTFSDADIGDTEGSSTYRWFTAYSSGGTYSEIPGQSSKQYVIASEDYTKYILFEVTVIDNHGLAGDPVSMEIGPVQSQPDIIIFNGGNSNAQLLTSIQSMCDGQNVSLGINATNVRPFISDASVNIKDRVGALTMLTVKSNNGDTIAASWADLWDANSIPLSATLNTASVLGVNLPWWSGSNADGTYNVTYNCSNWGSKTGQAVYGWSASLDGGWLSYGNDFCSFIRAVLCVGW